MPLNGVDEIKVCTRKLNITQLLIFLHEGGGLYRSGLFNSDEFFSIFRWEKSSVDQWPQTQHLDHLEEVDITMEARQSAAPGIFRRPNILSNPGPSAKRSPHFLLQKKPVLIRSYLSS